MSMSFKASPDGLYGEILVNGQVVAKLPLTGNAVIPGLVGTVSQVGGVPTGAVVERGSNANGEYTRFADGTQICTGLTPAQTCATTYLAGSLFYNGTPCTGTFAAAFIAVPRVSAVADRADGAGISRITGSSVVPASTTTTPGYRGIAEANTNTVSFNYTAIGRWF